MKQIKRSIRETLINCLCGMKRKAHGAQEPRHIVIYRGYSAAQRSDSPAQAINQGFLCFFIIIFMFFCFITSGCTNHATSAPNEFGLIKNLPINEQSLVGCIILNNQKLMFFNESYYDDLDSLFHTTIEHDTGHTNPDEHPVRFFVMNEKSKEIIQEGHFTFPHIFAAINLNESSILVIGATSYYKELIFAIYNHENNIFNVINTLQGPGNEDRFIRPQIGQLYDNRIIIAHIENIYIFNPKDNSVTKSFKTLPESYNSDFNNAYACFDSHEYVYSNTMITLNDNRTLIFNRIIYNPDDDSLNSLEDYGVKGNHYLGSIKLNDGRVLILSNENGQINSFVYNPDDNSAIYVNSEILHEEGYLICKSNTMLRNGDALFFTSNGFLLFKQDLNLIQHITSNYDELPELKENDAYSRHLRIFPLDNGRAGIIIDFYKTVPKTNSNIYIGIYDPESNNINFEKLVSILKENTYGTHLVNLKNDKILIIGRKETFVYDFGEQKLTKAQNKPEKMREIDVSEITTNTGDIIFPMPQLLSEIDEKYNSLFFLLHFLLSKYDKPTMWIFCPDGCNKTQKIK